MSEEQAQVESAPIQDTAPQTAVEVNETPEIVEELEEIEYESERFKVPKKLKDAFLRREDYTRKTQEVADQRRAIETEFKARQEAIERERELVQSNEELAALRHQLKAYEKLTPQQWQEWGQSDPSAAQAAFLAMQSTKDRAASLQSQLEQDRQRKAFETQQKTARQIEQAISEVRAAIPDFSEAKDRELADYARKQLGAPQDATGLPPWVIKAVYKASLYDKSLKSATAQEPQAQAAPIKTISGASRATVDPSKMSMAEWVKWDNERMRKKLKG